MNNSKRQRTANFTPNEKTLILTLVCKHRRIINNKKTDSATNKQKMLCWEQIADEFNYSCIGGIRRSTDSLKKFYNNKKKEARKVLAKRKSFFKETESPSKDEVSYLQLTLSSMDESAMYELKTEDCGDSEIEPAVDDDDEGEENNKEMLRQLTEEFLVPVASPRVPTAQTAKTLNDDEIPPTKKRLVSELNDEQSNQTADAVSAPELDSIGVIHVEIPKSKEVAIQTMACRRRPTSETSQARYVSKTYSELAQKKLELLEAQIEEQKREDERKVVEFMLKKELLELEIQVRKEELKKLKCPNVQKYC